MVRNVGFLKNKNNDKYLTKLIIFIFYKYIQ